MHEISPDEHAGGAVDMQDPRAVKTAAVLLGQEGNRER